MLLSGCSAAQPGTDVSKYESYYRAIEENTKFITHSEYYSISAEMAAIEDGTYRYYVIIDEPTAAMYDIVIMTAENGLPYEETVKMMPSSGIFDATSSMIPNQVNSKAGFVKGIIVSGECDTDSIDLQLLIEWKDKSRKQTTREFVGFTLTMDGIKAPERTSEDSTAEEGEG